MAVRNCMAKKDTFGRVAKKNNQKSRWFQSVGLGMQYTTVCYGMNVANATALAMSFFVDVMRRLSDGGSRE